MTCCISPPPEGSDPDVVITVPIDCDRQTPAVGRKVERFDVRLHLGDLLASAHVTKRLPRSGARHTFAIGGPSRTRRSSPLTRIACCASSPVESRSASHRCVPPVSVEPLSTEIHCAAAIRREERRRLSGDQLGVHWTFRSSADAISAFASLSRRSQSDWSGCCNCSLDAGNESPVGRPRDVDGTWWPVLVSGCHRGCATVECTSSQIEDSRRGWSCAGAPRGYRDLVPSATTPAPSRYPVAGGNPSRAPADVGIRTAATVARGPEGDLPAVGRHRGASSPPGKSAVRLIAGPPICVTQMSLFPDDPTVREDPSVWPTTTAAAPPRPTRQPAPDLVSRGTDRSGASPRS